MPFGKEFFYKYQGILLWLLNAPIIKYWFRWVLRIHKDLGKTERICNILPNCYTVFLGREGKNYRLYTDFRTHNKFSKRLYYAFRPLWWAMHLWDMGLPRMIPQLSFGFDTLTEWPDEDPETDCVDGLAMYTGTEDTWANVIAAAGNYATDNDAVSVACLDITAGTTTDYFTKYVRAFYLFNTSALTSEAVITAAVLSLYGSDAATDDLSCSPDWDIYTSNPASNTALVNADYSTLGSTSQTGGSSIALASWNSSAYNDYTFDATGRGNISKTGISKFGGRNANYDVAATIPNWISGARSRFYHYWADQAGTANDPKIVVTYTLPATGPVMIGRYLLEIRSDGTSS